MGLMMGGGGLVGGGVGGGGGGGGSEESSDTGRRMQWDIYIICIAPQSRYQGINHSTCGERRKNNG